MSQFVGRQCEPDGLNQVQGSAQFLLVGGRQRVGKMNFLLSFN
jgi:hypothetical protein